MNDKDLFILLMQVKDSFFKDHQITMLGKFEWLPITEKEIIRYKKKTGKQLKFQFRKFRITKKFIDYKSESKNTSVSVYLKFYHLLISDLNQEDSTFYVIGDNCVGPLLGEKVRYKFRLESIDDKTVAELIEKDMIAIRQKLNYEHHCNFKKNKKNNK